MVAVVPSRRDQIERLADWLRRKLEVEPPVDPRDALARLGVDLREGVDLEGPEAVIEHDPSGRTMITLDDFTARGGRAVTPGRVAFALAHLIGHLLLHTDHLRTRAAPSRDRLEDLVTFGPAIDRIELEAHQFAAALLMPRIPFREAVEQLGVTGRNDLEPLAERFGVSHEAALMRGRWLGLFDWSQSWTAA